MTTKERETIERNVRLWEAQREKRERRIKEREYAEIDAAIERAESVPGILDRVKRQASEFSNPLPL